MKIKFHHIAVAVHDIEKSKQKYELLGYKAGDTVWDDIQNVSICFLSSKQMPLIELVASTDPNSPIKKILEKNGVIPYHTCYSTNDFENDVLTLSNEGFVKLSDPVEAVAINDKRIVFMYNSDFGLLELVEE
jgi:methylmalonyl-CoA/ethylmalonyl-CoA epimerase